MTRVLLLAVVAIAFYTIGTLLFGPAFIGIQ